MEENDDMRGIKIDMYTRTYIIYKEGVCVLFIAYFLCSRADFVA